MDKKNEENLIYYLTKTKEYCPELVHLFYPMTRLALDYLYVFDDLFDDNDVIVFDDFPVQKTLDLVCQFLNNYDQSYLDKFNKAFKDGTIDIFYKEFITDEKYRLDIPISIENEENSSINVPLCETFEDGGVIIHEFFHFTNSKGFGVRNVFTELISIYMELKYYKFLQDKGYSIDSFYKELYLRLKNTYISSDNISYSGSILDVYENTNSITKDSILFMDKYRDRYEDNLDNLLDFSSSDEFTECIFDFHVDVSYLLGCVIALNLLKNEKLSDIKIKYINENINSLSIEEILRILDIDLDNYQELIDCCKDLYDKAEGVLNESNNNNRSYIYRKNKT